MIRFSTLSMKNFLSYGAVPTVLDLDRPGTSLILGEDLDNTSAGVGANGVGKTVIINALVYALYDKPISNISKDNLVNNINKKNMEVTLDFTVHEKAYHIKRARKTKAGAAGNWVHLFEDGQDITPDSVANTNVLIEKIIGLPFDLFVRIVAISATHTPFLDLPVRSPTQSNQTDIIEELFDLKTLSEKAVFLKEEIKEADGSLKIHQVRLDSLEKEHARHAIQTESAEKRVVAWHTSNKNEIAAIKRKLKKIAGVDVEGEQAKIDERHVVARECQEAQTELDRETTARESLHRERVAAETVIKDERKKIGQLKKDKCHACGQDIKDAKIKIAKAEDFIRDQEAILKHILEDWLESEEQTKVADAALKAGQARHKELTAGETVDDIDELIEIVGKKAALEKELETKQKANNPFAEPLQELLDVELDEIDMEKINELTTLIEHQKFLLKLLTQKDSFVRKALLNKNIPFLNQRLAYYLTDLGLPHTVEFTHEMTASISQFGRPLDFGNLSNGQRARVNLALSFAFRDVLQSIHHHVNVCMLDEVLDVGLDAVGVQAAAKMLKRKARDEKISLYIISHRDEIDSAFDRRLNVQMSKGFSYISEED